MLASEAEDLALLRGAARAAGEIALRYWKKQPEVWDKGGSHGPVTEADLAVNAMLSDTLRAARPGYGWLSEETPDTGERLQKRRTFIIDPIDGTRAFIAGENTFAHSLAVAEEGRIIAAAVYLPALDRLYAASAAGQATRNDAPIRASAQSRVEGASVVASKPNLMPGFWPGGVPALHRSFRPSLAYRLCLVAEGRFDSMVAFRPTWDWDIAAGALIAARAGAVVTDGQGGAIGFNATDPRAPGVIAASPGLHAGLLALRT